MKEELAMRKAKENPKHKTTSSPISRKASDASSGKKRKLGEQSQGSKNGKTQHTSAVEPQDPEALTDLLLLSEASSVRTISPKKQKTSTAPFSIEKLHLVRIYNFCHIRDRFVSLALHLHTLL